MEPIKSFFANITDGQRMLILWGGLVFFYLIEYAVPLFRMHYNKLRHAGVNVFFTVTTLLVNVSLAFILLQASLWTEKAHFGILYLVNLPGWLFMITGLLLMDLIGAYTVHLVEHKVKWMWRFHLIHHADQQIDTTSANRHHPGESVFRFVFTTIATIIVGAPFWVIMLYQSMSVVLSQFNHANIKLPSRLDKVISLLFVSPNMHKVHHHFVQPYTDSNYGNIFSIWDRLFGTFKTLAPGELKYGIDTHLQPKESDHIGNLLAMPFQPYRAPEGSKFSE